MKKSRFTEAQIVGVLQEHEKGAKISELCRRRTIASVH
jgi:putative transposase